MPVGRDQLTPGRAEAAARCEPASVPSSTPPARDAPRLLRLPDTLEEDGTSARPIPTDAIDRTQENL